MDSTVQIAVNFTKRLIPTEAHCPSLWAPTYSWGKWVNEALLRGSLDNSFQSFALSRAP